MIFAKCKHLNFDNKNGYFQCHRKTTKITFFSSVFFLLKSSLQAQCINNYNFWQRSFLSPHISYLYCTGTLTYHRNFAHVVSSVVATSKICRGRSRNPSRVESQGYFISWWPFFQFNKQWAKLVNKVQHLTSFIEKLHSELPTSLMMLIRQLLKMKNGCELTKNRRNTIFQPLLQVNKAKWEHHNDVSSKLEPWVFKNSSTIDGNVKYGVAKAHGVQASRKSLQKCKSPWEWKG